MITSRSRRRLFWTLSGSALLVALTGACNAILDNNAGILVTTEGAGTFPAEDSGTSTPAPTTEPVDSGSTAPIDAATLGDGGLPDCPAGQHRCNGQCVSTSDPTYGCGSPACTPCVVAHGAPACVGGACAVATCDPGFANCNANPADGCEVDLSKPATCGSCTAACPATTPVCAPVGGTYQCGTGCPPTAPTRCGDECVDLLTSANHCGTCPNVCAPVENATVACTTGVCTFTCRPDFRACGGRCTAVTDPAACGPGCVVCPPAANARPTCAADVCRFECNMGFGDCDALPANGCEANFANNPAHCGGCNRPCPSGVCNAGVCAPLPDGG